MLFRKIHSSGESLPVIGLGTWQKFDVQSKDAEDGLTDVIKTMHAFGGKLIDSSPMYGRAESVVGNVSQNTGIADEFFYASKVWTTGAEKGKQQILSSLKKMQRPQLDLMQVHNLQDWKTHLQTLNHFKKDGLIRYTGMTHYRQSAHQQLETIIRSEKIDFVQFNYSIAVTDAENSLLDCCIDQGVSLIVNEPFDRGNVFFTVNNRPLPDWAKEYEIEDWTGFFLKYIISHPAVTCVIPGTSNPAHIKSNMRAGSGPLPDKAGRRKMLDYFRALPSI